MGSVEGPSDYSSIKSFIDQQQLAIGDLPGPVDGAAMLAGKVLSYLQENIARLSNNQLGAIGGFTERFSSDDWGPELKQAANRVSTAAQEQINHSSRPVRRRGGGGERESMDLDGLEQRIRDTLSYTNRIMAELERRFPSRPAAVVAPQVKQDCARKAIDDLYQIVGVDPEKRDYFGPVLDKVEGAQDWAMKLMEMAEFTSTSEDSGELKKALASKILSYLDKANTDPGFLEVFKEIIAEAKITCGDRVSLSILKMGINYKIMTVDKTNLPELSHLLINGSFLLSTLENVARTKVKDINEARMQDLKESGKEFDFEEDGVDQIEVYLGYPIQLKAELDIPIDVEFMRFYTCSDLTEGDIEAAKEFANSSLLQSEAKYEQLVSDSTWKDALSNKYPEKYALIQDRYEQAYDCVSLGEDSKVIEVYQEGLIALSKHAILARDSEESKESMEAFDNAIKNLNIIIGPSAAA